MREPQHVRELSEPASTRGYTHATCYSASASVPRRVQPYVERHWVRVELFLLENLYNIHKDLQLNTKEQGIDSIEWSNPQEEDTYGQITVL